ncbi:MAG: HAD hydrolase family protein [Elusimicrobiaceae bacterium]|nr:HAD hydrolase family protein [Elusimicrobiaceae bacterium]
MQDLSSLFIQKAKNIKVLLTDVDGVMTDGTLSFFTDDNGRTHEIKHFESLDGMGLMYLAHCGIKTGIISRGNSPTLEFWAEILGMDFLFYNTAVKHHALDYLQQHFDVKPEETAFIGDDLIDLGVLARVGLPLAVANSVQETKEKALYVSPLSGGHAAVRDIAEKILQARGEWNRVVTENLQEDFKAPKRNLHIVKGL